MPNYNFQCPKGHEFEKVTLIAERDNLQPCPKCQLLSERQPYATAVAFNVHGGTPKFYR